MIHNYLTDNVVQKVVLYNIIGQTISTWNIESQSQQNIELPIKKLVLVYMQSNYKLLGNISKKK
jgi:hypothetical protein